MDRGGQSGEEINGARGRGFLLGCAAAGDDLPAGIELHGGRRAVDAAGMEGHAGCRRMRRAGIVVGDLGGRRGRLADAGREERGSRGVNHFVILQSQKAENSNR